MLIVENMKQEVQGAFESYNEWYHDGAIQFFYRHESQTLPRDEQFDEFAFIFVDIDLAPSSEYDGYGIIESMIPQGLYYKTAILTGSSKVEETLKRRGIGPVRVLYKPLDLDKINDFLVASGFHPTVGNNA